MPSKKNSKGPPDTRPRPIQKRFVVRSAEEAVTQVREVLGPDARVISVRQVKGGGLQRFLAAPRLEIIAQAADLRTAEKPTGNTAQQSAGRVEEPRERSDAKETESRESIDESGAAAGGGELSKKHGAKAESADRERPVEALEKAQAPVSEIERRLKAPTFKDMKCGEYLGRAGFSDQIMSRLASHEQWRSICAMPLQEGLTHAVSYLREDRQNRVQPEMHQRVAFVGGAGSGKTTALCKLLARDTFLRNRAPQVLRLETDRPHMDDGLPLYCDVLGLQCCRSEADLDTASMDPIYIDVPGFSLGDPNELKRIRELLDKVGAESRVLVMNGAYEMPVLKRFLESGDQLGASFQVVSHIDELVTFGKFWDVLFDTQRHLMFFSNGQNVASDLIEDTFGFLLERTFPR